MNFQSLLILTLFLITSPLPALSFSISSYQTLFSISHSLMSRVANLRESRGDFAGSDRARAIAKKLEHGIGFRFWRFMWSMGWDYMRNYAWRDASTFELFGAVSDMNELMKSLNELTRMDRTEERMAWVQRNYSNVLRNSKSLFGRLLKMFRQSGPLREAIETLQKEVVEGDLLRDCLELGGNDLKGFVQILRDIALQSSSASASRKAEL